MPDPEPSESARSTGGLTHVDARGRANMVDVSGKPVTTRRAVAEATIRLDAAVRGQLLAGTLHKGEALAVARIAGIQAAKETARLVPLCHSLLLSRVGVEFAPVGDDAVLVTTEVVTEAATGVEMEALVAASIAALTIYDMTKAQCRGASIENVRLLHKSGGRSGPWDRHEAGRGPEARP